MSLISGLLKTVVELDSKININNLNDVLKLIAILKKKGIWSIELNNLFQLKIKELRFKTNKQYINFNENQHEKYKIKILGNITNRNDCPIKIPKKLFRKIIIKQISHGGFFACILSMNGEIYSCGSNSFGQLGIGNNMDNTKIFKKIDIPKCNYICCGYSYTLAKGIDNSMYSWGAGNYGRLGQGHCENVYYPTKLPNNFETILNFFTGSAHNILLTKYGSIYTWGQKYYTGHNEDEDILSPRKLIIDNNVSIKIYKIGIGIGGYHTIVVTESNEIYSWGHNRVGQLGISLEKNKIKNDTDSGLTIIPIPTKIKQGMDKNLNIMQIACGWGHTIILYENGSVWTFGRNFRGQLGIDKNECFKNDITHYMHIPTEILFFRDKKIIHVFAGGEYSGAVSDNGDIYMWGDNSFQNIPILGKNVKWTIYPTKINISKPLLISSGFKSTIFLH